MRHSLFLTLLSLLLPAVSALRCFDASGNANPDLIPCDASATVSSCCAATEYCLDNGLCLNAMGNNFLSTKGCSDANWGAPCKKFCPGAGLGNSLFPCANTFGSYGNNVLYCCGPDPSSCCSGRNAFQVPVGKVVLRPIDVASSTASSTSPTNAAASAASMSSSSSALTTSTTSTAPIATSSVPASGPDSKSLAIGLGVGIPLGLAFIGGIVFLGVELRRYNRYRAIEASNNGVQANGSTAGGYPTPKDTTTQAYGHDMRSTVHELSQ